MGRGAKWLVRHGFLTPESHLHTRLHILLYGSGMASVRKYTAKDGQDTWRVRYRLDGRSCSKTFTDERSADVFGEMVDRWGPKQALEFIKEPTTPREKKGTTVAAAVERYVELRQPKTRQIYEDMARLHINPTLGETPISKLKPEAVQLWANGLGKSAGTVRLAHSVLSGSLALAVNQGEIDRNPARKASKTSGGVRLPRTRSDKEPVFLSREEYELFLKAMDDHYKPLVEFLANSGCRIGEATALTPADINLRTGKVRFNKTFSPDNHGRFSIGTTKTESSDREIVVPRDILEKLDLSGEHVFTNTIGNQLTQNRFRSGAWAKAAEKSGLPTHRQPGIHDLRHTHASWLLDAGVSIHAVQQRLGHSDVMTTLRIYGHAAADSEDRILNALTGSSQQQDKGDE